MSDELPGMWEPADFSGGRADVEDGFDEIIRQKLIEGLGRALTEAGVNWCLVCGGTLLPHDDAACAAKIANWNPRGITP